MNELIQRLTQKTGLSPEKAQEALNVILGHLREKLPSGIASHLDAFFGDSAGSEEGGGGGVVEKGKAMAQGLGSMFDKKEE